MVVISLYLYIYGYCSCNRSKGYLSASTRSQVQGNHTDDKSAENLNPVQSLYGISMEDLHKFDVDEEQEQWDDVRNPNHIHTDDDDAEHVVDRLHKKNFLTTRNREKMLK